MKNYINKRLNVNLKSYLKLYDITQSKFAEEIGYSANYISNIVNGYQIAGRKLREKCKIASHGEISLSEWPKVAQKKQP